MKRKYGITNFIGGLLAGLVFLGISGYQKYNEMKPAIDITDPDFDYSTLKPGDHVKCKIFFVMDSAVVYSEESSSKKTTETSRTYCLPHLSDDGEYINMDAFMGLNVRKADYDKLDELAEISNKWWNMESDVELGKVTYKLDGTVKKMATEEEKYFREYVEDCGGDTDQIVALKVSPISGASNVGLVIGGVITAIFTVLIVLRIKEVNRDNKREPMQVEGYEGPLC